MLQDKITVDNLLNNICLDIFDPLSFTGYHRTVPFEEYRSLMEYLAEYFYLPTSIICASRKTDDSNSKLHVVDGHRSIYALQAIKDQLLSRYNKIKNYEVSVILLEDISESDEIDTFININQNSIEDKSLAYVRKNRIKYENSNIDLNHSRREYLSVELAHILNEDYKRTEGLFINKISYDETTHNAYQLIDLHSFVRSIRSLIADLENHHAIELKWDTQEDIFNCLDQLVVIHNQIWRSVFYRWPKLFDSNIQRCSVIQGTNGYRSINKFLSLKMDQSNIDFNEADFETTIVNWIKSIHIPYNYWLPEESFAQYTYSQGYKLIAHDLLDSSSDSQ